LFEFSFRKELLLCAFLISWFLAFPGAFHQVVNAGPNVGEAVNFCTMTWQRDFGHLARRCTCKGLDQIVFFDYKLLGKSNSEEDKKDYWKNMFEQYNFNEPSPSSSSSSSGFVPNYSGPSSSVPSSSHLPSSGPIPASSSLSSSNIQPPPPSQKHFCHECNRSFSRNFELKRHLKFSSKHCPSPGFVCEKCLKTFTQKASLTRHKKDCN
jgi:hypothetical protein